jgi:hypothetical protein
MTASVASGFPRLLDERSRPGFREVFGRLLSKSKAVDTAILRIRLAAVDLSGPEIQSLERLRVVVAEVNAQTVGEEAYALLMDPDRRQNLERVLRLLQSGTMEIRCAALAGWSPDFTVFSGHDEPEAVLLGLHWFQRPFPHRGPAWAMACGPDEARRAKARFRELWAAAHDITAAVQKLLEQSSESHRPTHQIRR